MKIKQRVFEFFNRGAGWRITSLVVDFKFLIWKIKYPQNGFSDFYAGSIASRLRRGHSHKTLGNKRFLSGSWIADSTQLDQSEIESRGTKYFNLAIRYGLKP